MFVIYILPEMVKPLRIASWSGRLVDNDAPTWSNCGEPNTRIPAFSLLIAYAAVCSLARHGPRTVVY